VAPAPSGDPQSRRRHPQHRPGNSTSFDTHLILTGADRYGLENLANLDRLPRRGATVVVGLIPYEQGSGGQARIFASLRSAAD
jgi:kynurenine formamidase